MYLVKLDIFDICLYYYLFILNKIIEIISNHTLYKAE